MARLAMQREAARVPRTAGFPAGNTVMGRAQTLDATRGASQFGHVYQLFRKPLDTVLPHPYLRNRFDRLEHSRPGGTPKGCEGFAVASLGTEPLVRLRLALGDRCETWSL